MDKKLACLKRELAALDLVGWQGHGVISVLEVGRLGVDEGIWHKANVKKVGLKEKEWSVLPDCAFDRVVLFEAIEECHWPEALLNAVWRVVRPDGLVIAVLPREGEEALGKKEIAALMEGARLKILHLEAGGKEDAVSKVLPWMGSVWWVVARKDVLNVRPLMEPQGKQPGRPALAG